ncbi:MAG TPA: hypothetical protein VGR45_01760 [Stellaceae bacterium]|nr:hypothetical protein [Stellaceae bacterium]
MTTRAADDYAAIRARMAELRRPSVVPGSEPAKFAVCATCRWSSFCGVVRRCSPAGVPRFSPDNCHALHCGDRDRCVARGSCVCAPA